MFAYGSVESGVLISTLILMFRDQIIGAVLLLLLKVVVVVVVVGELSGLVCRGVGPEGVTVGRDRDGGPRRLCSAAGNT